MNEIEKMGKNNGQLVTTKWGTSGWETQLEKLLTLQQREIKRGKQNEKFWEDGMKWYHNGKWKKSM